MCEHKSQTTIYNGSGLTVNICTWGCEAVFIERDGKLVSTYVPEKVNAQITVFDNVTERGYHKGWTGEQFTMRQLMKTAEELGEAIGEIDFNTKNIIDGRVYTQLLVNWASSIHSSGNECKKAFDSGIVPDYTISNPANFAAELADVLVTLFCAAQSLSDAYGTDFDLVQMAIDKSVADVKRGVR